MSIKQTILMTSLMLSAMLSNAETKIFDTITMFSSGASWTNSSISGTEKDSGNSITATFEGLGNKAGQSVGSVCTPLILTAMEKPGRYYLHVSHRSPFITSCALELKPQPQS